MNQLICAVFRIAIINLLFLVGLSMCLKCYICHTNDNDLCTDDFLKECPKNQAYDRCRTTLYKNAKDGLNIKKDCALAPCHLRDPSLKFIQFKEECVSSKQECVFCCPEDGCNRDGVSKISSNSFLTLFLIILVIMFLKSAY